MSHDRSGSFPMPKDSAKFEWDHPKPNAGE